MRVLFCLLVLMLTASPAFSLSLKQMQDQAAENRQTIKRYEINLQESDHDLAIARSGYKPSVDVSYTSNRLNHSTLTEDKENSTIYGGITWNLFNGFATKYGILSAEEQKEVKALQLTGIKQDIKLNVALRYLNVYERKANLDVAKKNYETLLKIYQDGQNRLDVGLIDKNELLKFKVDLDNSNITKEAAQAGLDKSVLLLGREIGADVSLADLNFAEFAKVPGAEDDAKNQALMLTHRSELQAYKKMITAAEYQVKVKKGSFYPKVDFLSSYANYDDDIVNTTGDTNSDLFRFQVQLSMNLYQGGAKKEALEKARLEVQGLKYDLAELTDDLTTELKDLHIDYAVSLRNVDVAQVSIEQAEENLRITRLKYDEGLQRESDLLDAVTNLSRAQYNYVTVMQAAFSNYFNIQRMVETTASL